MDPALRDGEHGQATVEWIGLVLAIALVLGALALGARGAANGAGGGAGSKAGARELGQALAERITCAARGLPERHLAARALAARGPAGAAACATGASAGPGAGRVGARPPLPPAVPPATRRVLPRLPELPRRRRGGYGSRLERVGGRAGRLAEGAWIGCLGYGAMRYDLEHPRTPREMRPIGATMDIVADCLNPWELLFG
jgi:hypothetical protein